MTYTKPEIIIGLIGALGTNFEHVICLLKKEFNITQFSVNIIRVSKFIPMNSQDLQETKRIELSIKRGNNLVKKHALNKENGSCEKNTQYGYLGAKIIEQITTYRKENKNQIAVCHIIQSIKRLDEINILEKVYGKNFILISIYTSSNQRKKYLIRKDNQYFSQREETPPSEKKQDAIINKLFEIDKCENTDAKFGQNVIDCYPKAHYFIKDDIFLKNDIERVVRLIFGDPFITPTKEELCMYVANALACKSSDLSRQVGAVLADDNGFILSAGCNDTPKFGGGTYWDGDDPDHRDFAKLKNDENDIEYSEQERNKIKESIIANIRKAVTKKDMEESKENQGMNDFKEKLKKLFKEQNKDITSFFKDTIVSSDVRDLIEFYRSVHAEVATLCNAQINNVNTKNKILYCTTFPCHLCCKTIIAAGIKKVLYIEPYPKSKSEQFYEDMIVDKPINKKKINDKVIFDSFRGIAPNRFLQLFRLKSKYNRKNKKNGKLNRWELKDDILPFYLIDRTPINYILREFQELKRFRIIQENWKDFCSEIIDNLL